MMEKQKQHIGGGGVKITYIETQFVTSDEAGFKDLVQRLTGRSPAAAAPAPAAVPHRPRARRVPEGRTAAAEPRPQAGYYHHHYPAREVRRPAAVVSRAPPCLEELHEMDDFDELFYVGAGERHHGFNGYYSDFPY